MLDDIIADTKSSKKLCPIVTELFLRRRKLGIPLVFVSWSYLNVCKTWKIMNIPNKRKLQQIASNHCFDIDFKDFKDYTKEPYSFLVNHTTLSSDNPWWIKKNLL